MTRTAHPHRYRPAQAGRTLPTVTLTIDGQPVSVPAGHDDSRRGGHARHHDPDALLSRDAAPGERLPAVRRGSRRRARARPELLARRRARHGRAHAIAARGPLAPARARAARVVGGPVDRAGHGGTARRVRVCARSDTARPRRRVPPAISRSPGITSRPPSSTRPPSPSRRRSTTTCTSATTASACSATSASRRAARTTRTPSRSPWPDAASTRASRRSSRCRCRIPRASIAATASPCARPAR